MKAQSWMLIVTGMLAVTAMAGPERSTAGRAALKARVTVSPVYPQASLAAGREGSTIVCFYVDTDGSVYDAMVLSSTHPDFEDAALDAARHTVYDPQPRTGSEDSYLCLRYRFRL